MEVNLLAIFIANGMGLMLTFGILLENSFHLLKKQDAIILYILDITTIVCCIIDPIVFAFDGHPGKLAWTVVYVGNFLLYLSNLIFGPAFLLLIENICRGKNSKTLIRMMAVADIVGLAVLFINLFKPILFYLDESNRYHRLSAYFLHTAIGTFFIAVAVVIYIYSRFNGGVFKVFPVISFVSPVFFGLYVQTYFYGVSSIWPSAAIGLTLMVMYIQNRNIQIDNLTGLFNRHYLKDLKLGQKSFALMMFDLNNFKNINDTYGHSEGDVALIEASGIINRTVGTRGIVVRYGGDEFIVLLNTGDEAVGQEYIDKIQHNLSDYNLVSGKPYQLSTSIGWGIFNLESNSMDEIIKIVDERMYEAKNEYYKTHDRRKR